jgi:uncharacterized protein (TIGR02271 family)
MIDVTQIERIAGADVRGPDDDKIGSAGRVYVNDTTGEPSWVTVSSGLFGNRVSFVPLQDAAWDGEVLRVPYDKGLIKNAPNLDSDGHLTRDQEEQLYAYYGVDTAPDGDLVPTGYEGAGQPDMDSATDDATHDATDDAMTRSEEHLEVDTEQHEAGRVRLRKYVVTEEQTVTVPVTREEVRVEREPITDANRDAALAGEPISEADHEIVLHEDRVVVTTKAEPVERVRISAETVTEEETVVGEVRKEQIDVEGAALEDHDDQSENDRRE